jgi:HTH-type transcriptional regulator/antitoxin HigA
MDYTIIRTTKQYKEYSKRLWDLANMKPSKKIEEEMELIGLFIDKWENNHLNFKKMDPIQLLKYLMDNRNIDRDELINILGISKSAVSQILNYKKGLSKEVIRKISQFFKVSQEAFNRNYELVSDMNRGHKDEKLMNTTKSLVHA